MEIARLESGETNYQALIHRPRVSYKISEYVWKYIYGICNRLLLNILQVISQKYGLNL